MGNVAISHKGILFTIFFFDMDGQDIRNRFTSRSLTECLVTDLCTSWVYCTSVRILKRRKTKKRDLDEEKVCHT